MTDARQIEWTVAPAERGVRFDVALHARLPDLSRSRAQALIRDGHARIDGAAARPGAPLKPGAVICVRVPEPTPALPRPEAIPLDILHEDGDIVVLNKPVGLVVHPAPGHQAGTLVNALLHHCRDLAGIGGEQRPGIVHRLDKDTSGVMVVAKHDRAMAALTSAFRRGLVTKEYEAIVLGRPEPPAGRIETLVGRSRHDRKKMAAQALHHTGKARLAGPGEGRLAVTHYRVEELMGPCARLRVRIETGRTHQIRLHLAHIGCPVLGDRQYGHRSLPAALQAAIPVARQMLHAERLAFPHPITRRPMEITAPLPPDMEAALEALRRARAAGGAALESRATGPRSR
jgi:23S rRNA pseudouridine1911/1915/1917 synthase